MNISIYSKGFIIANLNEFNVNYSHIQHLYDDCFEIHFENQKDMLAAYKTLNTFHITCKIIEGPNYQSLYIYISDDICFVIKNK